MCVGNIISNPSQFMVNVLDVKRKLKWKDMFTFSFCDTSVRHTSRISELMITKIAINNLQNLPLLLLHKSTKYYVQIELIPNKLKYV